MTFYAASITSKLKSIFFFILFEKDTKAAITDQITLITDVVRRQNKGKGMIYVKFYNRQAQATVIEIELDKNKLFFSDELLE